MSIKNLAAALIKAQSEMSAIEKDEKNPHYRSTYASLNAVRETAIPPCNKYGIAVVQPTVTVDGKQFVKTQLIHAESGEILESLTEVIVKSANDAQQAGSGITYARRYGLMSILCLASVDDDGTFAVGKPTLAVTPAPTAQAAPQAPATTDARPKVSFNKKNVEAATAKPAASGDDL